jgi:hypothetical protein
MNRRVLSVMAALTVVAASLAIILLFGLIPLPTFGSLIEDPDPVVPGTVAFVRMSGADRPCVHAVPAGGGEQRRVWCADEEMYFAGQFGWTPQGSIAILLSEPRESEGPTWLVIDPGSGRIVRRETVPWGPKEPGSDVMSDRRTWDGSRLVTQRPEPGRVLLRIEKPGEAETRLSLNGPRDYDLVDVQWSPDGQWVLIRDSALRLAVVDVADSSAPGLIAEDVEGAAWFIEGWDRYTIDLDSGS